MTSAETSTERPAGSAEGAEENPLVAKSESPSGVTTGWGNPQASELDRLNAQTAGSGLFNDVSSTITDFAHGDWGNAAMDVVTDGLDLLGAAMDPLGTLASAGVGFLIEHISFLKEGLDLLAGNPEEVTAKAVTWQNVAKQLTETADAYEKSASKAGESYKGGDGAAAYQATAKGYADSLRGAAGHAQSASTAMQVGAAIVGTERGLIRDMISEFVGALIVKGLAALATSWCSFGGTVAAFIADTVVEGGILAEKISTRIAKVVQKLETLAKGAGRSKAAIEAAANALKKIGRTADKIVDRSLNAATKIESKANELKQAGREAKEASEAQETARELKEAGGLEKKDPEKSFLNPEKWGEGDGVPGWNLQDSVAAALEGRRQENEQGDRWHEATEAYEKEHPEGEPGGKPAEAGTGEAPKE
ncbi:hypothetical protein ORV05_11890 [Amycolatopsis cynarae]|uniref:Rhs protein n=1 Tax=Amycolatopsis cynarae TaxID=2995223 RepID=A0ABY7B9U3_9PSEU|nr:hypothetical protein [Amycolatopsis sp. HUAS 11-8]WAL68433.1 hypothetical protein ORV05_11890 [Amycolatopsis sp. HUAS 11-8]